LGEKKERGGGGGRETHLMVSSLEWIIFKYYFNSSTYYSKETLPNQHHSLARLKNLIYTTQQVSNEQITCINLPACKHNCILGHDNT
jgi:hypothetical protein